ncbi:MAG: RsmE family RNA methyltransferase [Candidatus Babeliales bacterium]
MQKAHEFAFYEPALLKQLSIYKENQQAIIDDKLLFHRITRILRLTIQDTFLLFDRQQHMQFELIIAEPKKKQIQAIVVKKQRNKILEPAITFFLPILKKDALEHTIYSMVECGATTVQLLYTQKVQRKLNQKEFDRLQNIMIAAAEQSKNFAFPILHEPKLLQEAIPTFDSFNVVYFFDMNGKDILHCLESIKFSSNKNFSIGLMIGPEGDLTDNEKEQLQEKRVVFCTLTPTILRAQQAAALSLGIFRSFLNKN